MLLGQISFFQPNISNEANMMMQGLEAIQLTCSGKIKLVRLWLAINF
jgi:hypothetical protein